MNSHFKPANILLPDPKLYEKWAVIACDQFTSDKAYWKRVREYVGGQPSALHVILPEAELEKATEQTIRIINQNMISYLQREVLKVYPDSYVYVERTLQDGQIRRGIVGMIDLEHYDYTPRSKAVIRATEQTVLERIPPRVAVREGAQLEFSHVIVFCDDLRNELIEAVSMKRKAFPLLYDFDLMENGGHISGWLISDEHAKELETRFLEYERRCGDKACYLVADGNHSLATAKHCYEKQKKNLPEGASDVFPARYAMIEMENIYARAIQFEPIHRIITQTDAEKLLKDISAISDPDGCPITWVAGENRGEIRINLPENTLPIAVMQQFLDDWLSENQGSIDYIHDDDALIRLAGQQNAIGFLMPGMDKSALFSYVADGNILPRKTFSLGHAAEKRYYLEGRKIK